VARVIAFVPDLLFGSHVLGALRVAGHEAVLVDRPESSALAAADVLVVDLTAEPQHRIGLVEAAGTDGVRTLAFYSHVEPDVRALAEQAGFDLVVPRSRMNREGPALVSRLASGD
jgi:hypothetical protein